MSPDGYDEDWASSLTAMRRVQSESINARIVLGGRVTKFKGLMPGIAEEADFALRARHPLYLMGGFGGCARDIATDMGLIAATGISADWPGRTRFSSWGANDLSNGLELDENRTLARTVHIDQAVALILRGMLRLRPRASHN